MLFAVEKILRKKEVRGGLGDIDTNSDPELIESPEFENRIGIWFYFTRTEGIGGVIKTKPADFYVREIAKT